MRGVIDTMDRLREEIENKRGFSNLEHWNRSMYDFLSGESHCCPLLLREGEKERIG